MPETRLEPLRWLDLPSRVSVTSSNGEPKVYFQVTGLQQTAALCLHRPVEELPRILSMLSPGHHLAAARALDNLFDVEPPPLAQTMRESLRQALFYQHHLGKFFKLCSGWVNPFLTYRSRQNLRSDLSLSAHLLSEMMQHAALAQEAVAILGGRSSHPITAIAGGVSRYLKEEQYPRLAQIAQSCCDFAPRLAESLHGSVLGPDGFLGAAGDVAVEPLSHLRAQSDDAQELALQYGRSNQTQNFSAKELWQKVNLASEAWTYQPFSYLGEADWPGLYSSSHEGLYMVGPLARLSGDNELDTPLAEEERQNMIADLGSFPHFSVRAAYWALLVELIQAAEKMADLMTLKYLTGPAIREVPQEMGQEGIAALESPEGLICHRYQVDARGCVENAEVLDAATQNNALRCLLAKKTVSQLWERGEAWQDEAKSRLEMVLLPV
jgi:F420-non-reducing hydrogenase large subunit